jgi:hypothetical protein
MAVLGLSAAKSVITHATQELREHRESTRSVEAKCGLTGST